jgi:hypothetical protein
MKNSLILILTCFIILFSSCQNTQVNNYNETIVASHDQLNSIGADFSSKLQTFVGKPERKEEFKKFIKQVREKIILIRKPVEDLAPQQDADFRKNALNLFDKYETLILTLNLKADLICAAPSSDNTIMLDVLDKIKNIEFAEQELIKSQYNYAEKNNMSLR